MDGSNQIPIAQTAAGLVKTEGGVPTNDISRAVANDDITTTDVPQISEPDHDISLQPVPEEAIQSSASTVVAIDIEHVAVSNDPRKWPRSRKVSSPSHVSNILRTK